MYVRKKRIILFFIIIFLVILRFYILTFNFNPTTDFFAYYRLSTYIEKGRLPKGPEPFLFPALMEAGKLLTSKFLDYRKAYILSSRLINFMSGLALTFVLFFIFKKLTDEEFFMYPVIFLVLNPYFIVPFSYEISDMLFLLFSFLTFLMVLNDKFLSAFFALLSSFTRFEGIVLFLGVFFQGLKKRITFFLYSAVSLILILFSLFYFKHAGGRFFVYVKKFFIKKEYIEAIKSPLMIVSFLYKNIFFFYSYKIPSALKWYSIFFILVVAILGCFFLYKKNKTLFFSMFFSSGLYFFAKLKHIYGANFPACVHKFNFFFYVFYVFILIGIYYILSFRKVFYKVVFYVSVFIIYVLSIFSFYVEFGLSWIHLFLIAPVLFVLIMDIFYLKKIKKPFIAVFLIFSFLFPYFSYSLDSSLRYFKAASHNALPIISNWLKDYTEKDEKVLFIGMYLGLKFYMGEEIRGKVFSFPFKRYKRKSIREVEKALYKFCRKRNIKIVIVENLTRKPDNPEMAEFQEFVFSTNNEYRYFKEVYGFLYRGTVVGKVLKPVLNLSFREVDDAKQSL